MPARPLPPPAGTRAYFVIAFLAVLAMVAAALGVTFPVLSGRVVDQSNIISSETRNAIEPKLSSLEAQSGIQLVVATVNSLEGLDIESYANQLFRSWKLGEKTKNNGVLLLVARNERRVRIEVGYGLEWTLTDALSKVIIANAIAPRFKAGDFNGGIARGVDDIITVLTTDASEWQQRPSLRLDSEQSADWPNLILILIIVAFVALLTISRRFRSFFFDVFLSAALSSGGSRGGYSGGGGFSGGGGSSGGGGASGSW